MGHPASYDIWIPGSHTLVVNDDLNSFERVLFVLNTSLPCQEKTLLGSAEQAKPRQKFIIITVGLGSILLISRILLLRELA